VKVGDLVRRVTTGSRGNVRQDLDDIGVIVDITTHVETYTSSGCKNYIVITQRGVTHRCWQGELEVVSESR